MNNNNNKLGAYEYGVMAVMVAIVAAAIYLVTVVIPKSKYEIKDEKKDQDMKKLIPISILLVGIILPIIMIARNSK